MGFKDIMTNHFGVKKVEPTTKSFTGVADLLGIRIDYESYKGITPKKRSDNDYALVTPEVNAMAKFCDSFIFSQSFSIDERNIELNVMIEEVCNFLEVVSKTPILVVVYKQQSDFDTLNRVLTGSGFYNATNLVGVDENRVCYVCYNGNENCKRAMDREAEYSL